MVTNNDQLTSVIWEPYSEPLVGSFYLGNGITITGRSEKDHPGSYEVIVSEKPAAKDEER